MHTLVGWKWVSSGLLERWDVLLSAISFTGTHIKLRPPEQLFARVENVSFSCASASGITVRTRRRCCFIYLFIFLLDDATLLTSDSVLFMADLFANTCCNTGLIFDSYLDFTTLELNLAHPASKKGRAVPMDKHWFDSLGPSGQWLVCDFFLLLFCYHANSAQSWKDLRSAGL